MVKYNIPCRAVKGRGKESGDQWRLPDPGVRREGASWFTIW